MDVLEEGTVDVAGYSMQYCRRNTVAGNHLVVSDRNSALVAASVEALGPREGVADIDQEDKQDTDGHIEDMDTHVRSATAAEVAATFSFVHAQWEHLL